MGAKSCASRAFGRIFGVALLGAAFMACGPTEGPTVVSLDFDDAHADQLTAIPLLAEHQMNATFFLPHTFLELGPNYLTLRDALEFQAAGHEIGGHTSSHPRLPDLSEEEQRNEVCGDRDFLNANGLIVDNFAYPAGARNAITDAVVAECGYHTARTSGGLCEDPGFFDSCDRAESLPPKDALVVRTHGSIKRERIPNRMRNLITDAYQNGGGWVHIIFHHVCEYCDDYSITADELDEFLTWLQDERNADRVHVLTVRDTLLDAPQM